MGEVSVRHREKAATLHDKERGVELLASRAMREEATLSLALGYGSRADQHRLFAKRQQPVLLHLAYSVFCSSVGSRELRCKA